MRGLFSPLLLFSYPKLKSIKERKWAVKPAVVDQPRTWHELFTLLSVKL